MNYDMNHVPGAGSIALQTCWPAVQYATTVPYPMQIVLQDYHRTEYSIISLFFISPGLSGLVLTMTVKF